MKKIDKICNIIVASAVCALVIFVLYQSFSLVDGRYGQVKKHSGIVVSSIYSWAGPVKEYFLLVRDGEGHTLTVECNRELYRAKTLGDTLTYRTRYGRYTNNVIDSYATK